MVKCYLRLMIILGIQQQIFSHSNDVQQKTSVHRHKMKKDIQDIQLRSKVEDPQGFIDNYDLIVSEPSEVTTIKPILRVGHRHHHRSRKHRPSKTDTRDPSRLRSGGDSNETLTRNDPEILTTVEDRPLASTPANNTFEANVKFLEEKVEAAIKNLTNYISHSDTKRTEEQVATTTYNPRKRNLNVSPAIPFYRRFNYLNDVERNKPQKWVHCLDLIAPRLQGMKDEEHPKEVSNAHGDVKRLAQLLYTNVSKFNAQDMVSILTQISKIRIRMYQWDQNAITTIFNIIIKGPEHSFRTLKAGIKVLFDNWHLDTSMLTVFLQQTRIFRPPCIEISGYSGFTKKPGGIAMYTKPDKPAKKKHNPDESCHSREEHKYNNDP